MAGVNDPKTTFTYSPADVIVTLEWDGGSHIIGDFNEITVKLAENRVSHVASATGHVTRVINASNLGSCEISVPQVSASNGKLTDAYEFVMKNYDQAQGFISITVKDNLGESLLSMVKASLVAPAEGKYAKESNNRDWTLEGHLDNHRSAGNALPVQLP